MASDTDTVSTAEIEAAVAKLRAELGDWCPPTNDDWCKEVINVRLAWLTVTRPVKCSQDCANDAPIAEAMIRCLKGSAEHFMALHDLCVIAAGRVNAYRAPEPEAIDAGGL